jgi:multiple sugar transport system ATP-binding protein
MAEVELKNVGKKFGNVVAVDDFSLTINHGEFMVFVGPSGCGKTTTLRMIAGLEDITFGEIFIDGRKVNLVPPKDRDIAMVFQNYALYPHMSVYQNMAFGLKLKKVPKEEIDRRVKETAGMLGIFDFLKRKPKELSGGQRQRVALGRAIVRTPKVYLFDEPLSNLDAKLRVQMRLELKKLHEQIGTTSIYVTHDQIEAMTMGDRIVVMKDGKVQQVGEPLEIYMHPRNRFVAGFIGSPTMNFIEGVAVEKDGEDLFVRTEGLRLPVAPGKRDALLPYAGREVVLGFRPEDLSESDFSESPDTFEAFVDVVQPVGNQIYVDVKVGGRDLLASISPQSRVKTKENILLKARIENLHFFDPETETAIG